MQSSDAPHVSHRKVFYIPGYDPMPARRYRELYRSEGRKQAEISGYDIAQRAIAKSAYAWEAKTRTNDRIARAKIRVLRWSDIVRGSMKPGIFATYLMLLRTAFIYIFSGALRRLMRMRKGPMIAALYPIGMLLLQLFVAVTLALYIAGYAHLLLSEIGSFMSGFLAAISGWVIWPVLANLVSIAVALGVVYALLRFFRSLDGRLYAYYLMHDYAYSAKLWGRTPPELDARMDAFANHIAKALQSDVQEVLVIGHSSGAHIAVGVLAKLIRDGRVPANGPQLSFLSIGQVIPMVSFLPKADQLRADLHLLSTSDDLCWIDVSAPGDGCCFALCDPVAVSGVAPKGRKWPLVISAAFSRTLSETAWKHLRRRYFRLHFQYLCAFDQPGTYDYFQITAGPMTLADRFEGRKPSQSRIDIPVSRYTSMAA